MIKFFKNVFSPRAKQNETDDLFSDWDLLSYEQLLDHFDVIKEENLRGEKNAPASNALTADDFHNSLNIRYQKLIASRVKEIQSRIEGLESRSEKALEDVQFLNDTKTTFTNKLDEDLESFEPVITEANSSVRSLKKEVNQFKEEVSKKAERGLGCVT